MTEAQIRKILERANNVKRRWSFPAIGPNIVIEVLTSGAVLRLGYLSTTLGRRSAYDLWKRLSILFPHRGYAPPKKRKPSKPAKAGR